MRISSKALLVIASLSLLSACAVTQQQPTLLNQPPADSLSTLKQYALAKPAPAGFGQLQYSELEQLFSQQSSSRTLQLDPVPADNREVQPGGFNCQRRTWFLLSLGLVPSICNYNKHYSLTLEDKDLGIKTRHQLDLQETKALWLFSPIMMPLPQWRFDNGTTDQRAVYTLIQQAADKAQP